MFDDPGAEVAEIQTDGATIKPLLNAIAVVGDSARLHIDEGGLSACLVGPANVFMGDISLSASAFDEYECESESVIGVNISELQTLVRRARKRSDDTLQLSINQHEITAIVSREYNQRDVVSKGTMQTADPESLRSEPNGTDLDFPAAFVIEQDPLIDAMSYGISSGDKAVKFETAGDDEDRCELYISGESDNREETVAITDLASPLGITSMYSADYISKVETAIKAVDSDAVNILFGSEYPIRFTMRSLDAPLSAVYTVAPRV